MMPVSRRKYDDLAARYQQLAENHDELKEELAASRRATLRLAGNYSHLLETGEPMPMFSRPSRVQRRVTGLEWRLAIARKAGARLLAAYFGEQRRADRLQRRLDDAVGLDPTVIRSSAAWQPGYQKPSGDKEVSA